MFAVYSYFLLDGKSILTIEKLSTYFRFERSEQLQHALVLLFH